jgi:transglutaminase-like putative cysteine protease
MELYLRPTPAIESDHSLIRAKARELVSAETSEREKLIRLFTFVRDQIPYNLFMISMHPDDFRATFVLEAGKGYCVQKAVLLSSLARSVGIPSRLALARIRNHRLPADLQARLGRNEFPGHGYNQFLLDGNWISAAPTFDAGLCNRLKVPVVEFDGRNDALLPAQSLDGGPYI